MSYRSLFTGWIALLCFSLASTLLSVWSFSPNWQALTGTVILLLAWLKARVILGRYLGLSQAPFWSQGFGISLAVFCLILLGLYLIPLIL